MAQQPPKAVGQAHRAVSCGAPGQWAAGKTVGPGLGAQGDSQVEEAGSLRIAHKAGHCLEQGWAVWVEAGTSEKLWVGTLAGP